MRRTLILLILVGSISCVLAQSPSAKPLNIYVVDVEGGNATLFVTPSGESVLIDSGNVPPGATRDADRIMAAAHDAGITQIDHLITTHYHGDHVGGLPELASRIPVRNSSITDRTFNLRPMSIPFCSNTRASTERQNTPSQNPETKFS